MIYGVRSNDPSRACTRISFRGYEISIAMDDSHRGGNTPLIRSSLAVFEDGNDDPVTYRFAGMHNTVNGDIQHVTGEILLEVMQNIAKKTPNKQETEKVPDLRPTDYELDMGIEAGERP